MKLRGIDFGPCIDASGLRNFFGDAYWFHRLPIINNLWYDFDGSTFVAKSTTFGEIADKMPLTKDFQPKELFPKRIWVDFLGNKMLNAVGLAGPGAKTVLREGFWKHKKHKWPLDRVFMISFAPEGKTAKERLASFLLFMEELARYIKLYPNHRFALQINLSCPNSNVSPAELIQEADQFLDVMRGFTIPVIIKVNLLVHVAVLRGIASHPACDALCLTNTIPFGELEDRIPWKKWFPNGSPLKEFGGGGLSGAPLFPLLKERVEDIKRAGIRIPLIVGGGITHPSQVNALVHAGLLRGRDAISIGSIATLRPWNIPGTIKRAHYLLG